jgi:hypothetical protein
VRSAGSVGRPTAEQRPQRRAGCGRAPPGRQKRLWPEHPRGRRLNVSAASAAGRPAPRHSAPAGPPPLRLEEPENRVVPSTTSDILYVGDNARNGRSAGNSAQSFGAGSGASLGTFVSGADSLKGLNGMIFDGAGHLLAANQDLNRGKPAEIMKYDSNTGAFEGDLVSFQDPHAPFAPRGIVLKDNNLYVASLQDAGTTEAGIAPDGEIDRHNATTGQFLGAYTPPGELGRPVQPARRRVRAGRKAVRFGLRFVEPRCRLRPQARREQRWRDGLRLRRHQRRRPAPAGRADVRAGRQTLRRRVPRQRRRHGQDRHPRPGDGERGRQHRPGRGGPGAGLRPGDPVRPGGPPVRADLDARQSVQRGGPQLRRE